MIEVTENLDGSMTIDWDPNDPVESIMNDWTAEDFIQTLTQYLNKLEKNGNTQGRPQTTSQESKES
jgi:hypothetical protein